MRGQNGMEYPLPFLSSQITNIASLSGAPHRGRPTGSAVTQLLRANPPKGGDAEPRG